MNTDNADFESIVDAPVTVGQSVRIGAGPLDGFEGVVIERTPSGRYLVELYQGVFVETDMVHCVI